jgi:TAG lipase/steryl ester hydrolase/phospholipase A2/LPA acyltransferase
MSFLQDTTLLPCTAQQGNPLRRLKPASTSQSQGRQLRSKGSIASLVSAARHPVAAIADVLDGLRDGLTKEERVERQRLENKKQILYIRLRDVSVKPAASGSSSGLSRANGPTLQSTNYEDWKAYAETLDDLEGNNVWKSIVDSPDYDAALIAARLEQLDEARTSCDTGRMLFVIRTALTRGLGEMSNIRLYKHTHVGTKDLVERYISSAMDTLNALVDISARSGCDSTESKRILEQVLFARQAFGRSALLLSGGATFGMNHIGVLKALWEARLLPRIISGASAGSIVCAVLCTRTDEEMPELLATFCYGDFAVFEEEGNEDGVLRKAARFLKFGALFDISHLTRVMKDLLGNMTFQEAYNRTRRILNICVSSASLYELPRLLNYVTAPNVLIWSAV